MRARVVLWSTPGLVSMKHFAINFLPGYLQSRRTFSSRFFIFSSHVFLQPEPTLDSMKQTKFIFTHPPED